MVRYWSIPENPLLGFAERTAWVLASWLGAVLPMEDKTCSQALPPLSKLGSMRALLIRTGMPVDDGEGEGEALGEAVGDGEALGDGVGDEEGSGLEAARPGDRVKSSK